MAINYNNIEPGTVSVHLISMTDNCCSVEISIFKIYDCIYFIFYYKFVFEYYL
jgi:hypothetical protein